MTSVAGTPLSHSTIARLCTVLILRVSFRSTVVVAPPVLPRALESRVVRMDVVGNAVCALREQAVISFNSVSRWVVRRSVPIRPVVPTGAVEAVARVLRVLLVSRGDSVQAARLVASVRSVVTMAVEEVVVPVDQAKGATSSGSVSQPAFRSALASNVVSMAAAGRVEIALRV